MTVSSREKLEYLPPIGDIKGDILGPYRQVDKANLGYQSTSKCQWQQNKMLNQVTSTVRFREQAGCREVKEQEEDGRKKQLFFCPWICFS